MTQTTDISAAWTQLVKCALLGSSRTPQLPGAAALLSVTLDPLTGESDATVLRESALLAPLVRAGRLVPAAPDGEVMQPDPAPNESRTPVNERAASHLDTILGMRGRGALMAEWLDACAAAGKRAPFRLLPRLLDAGKSPQTTPGICRVIGARGFWLAARNPGWSYIKLEALQHRYPDEPDALDIDAQEEGTIRAVWSTGAPVERFAFLKALRRVGSPLALELVRESWKQETAEDRKRAIHVIADGATLDDEEFLESALDDRSIEVRWSAAEALMPVSGSSLSARYRERAQRLIRLTKPLIGKVRLDVSTGDVDRTLLRDGLEKIKGHQASKGLKGLAIQLILSAVPPQFWLNELGVQVTSKQFYDAATASDWSDAILSGLRTSTERFRDASFLGVLTDESGDLFFSPYFAPTECAAAQLENLAKCGKNPQELFHVMLRSAEACRKGDASALEIGRAFIRHLKHAILSGADFLPISYREPAVNTIANWLPLELTDDVTSGWPEQAKHWENWKPVVDTLIDTFNFRREMVGEINAS